MQLYRLSFFKHLTSSTVDASIRCITLVLILLPAQQLSAQPDPDCVASESNLQWWREIAINRDEERINADALAYDLLPCLGSANSELRDSLGYGLYTYWLRNDLLNTETKGFLYTQLSEGLSIENTLFRSYSALILSELLRADAIDEFLSNAQRETLLQQAGQALRDEVDFRGLDPELGWVHPIAHLSDVLWRMALHPSLNSDQARQILAAIRNKATPVNEAYQFNEGDRLARVIVTLMQRDLVEASQWLAWFSEFESRMSGEDWGSVFADVEGMKELHNAKLFLRALSDQLEGVNLSAELQGKIDAILAILTDLV